MLLDLSWPPSVNAMWRHVVIHGRPRVLLSEQGRAYRDQINRDLWHNGYTHAQSFGSARLQLWITAFPPDKRKRDLDNVLKGLFDALEKSGLFNDDQQIDKITLERGARVVPGGLISMEIKEHA